MDFLEVAGLVHAIEPRSPAARKLVDFYAAYRVEPDAAADLQLELAAEDTAPSSPVDLEVRRGGNWLRLRGASLRIGGPEAGPGDLERLWMHGLAAVLADRGGLVVHGAAVEGESGAVAFLGPSGAGKTTAARNCPTPVLSSDRIAIGQDVTGWWLAPLPFLYGEPRDAASGRRPVDRLLFVEKSGVNALVPVRHCDLVARLTACVLMPPEPRMAAAVLDTVSRLVDAVHIMALKARIDGGFWPLLYPAASVAPGGQNG